MVVEEKPAQILIKAALIEAPILIAGVVMFLKTGNPMWVIAGAIIGSMIIIPAILKVVKLQERG